MTGSACKTARHARIPSHYEFATNRVILELERVCLREGPSRYSNLILTGHSEGGLILRSTIAEVVKEFHQQNEKYLLNQPSGNPGALAAQIRAEGQAKGWTQSQISAVITRQISMLESSVAPSAPAIAEAKLRLFAPAIMGARPSRLDGSMLALSAACCVVFSSQRGL